MKILNKLSKRYKQFKLHPVSKGKVLKAMFNYIWFNISIKFKKELIYNWIGNLKFYVRKGDAGIVGNVYFGLYEFEESIFLLHFLEGEDVFLDIGANIGHYSLLISGIKKCKSIAIEPVPNTFKQLERQIKLNNLDHLITKHNIGVSNEKGKLFFSTDKGTMDRIVKENYLNKVEVQVEKIDSITKNNIPIAIKIDVEGYEKFALDGAIETLKDETLKVVILELNNSGKKYGIEDRQIYEQILKEGFKPFSFNYKTKEIIELDGFNKNKFNTLFIRDKLFVLERLKNSKSIYIWNKQF